MANVQKMYTIQRQLSYLDVWMIENCRREFGGRPSIYSDDMIAFQSRLDCQNTRGACSTQYENLFAIIFRHSAR